MKNSSTIAKKVLIALLVTSAVLLITHVLLKYVSIVKFNEQHGFLFELSNRFDVNDESSVPQWFSHMIFLLIGMSAILAAYMQKSASSRYFWLAIGCLGIILSLDDVAALHEFALQSIHNTYFLDTTPTFLVNAWLILLPAVLLAGSLLAWWAWRVLPRRTFTIMVIGGVVYVFGKILMDSAANEATSLFMDKAILQGMEKLFQYTGSSLVLFSVIDFIETKHGKQISRGLEQLKSAN